MKDKDKGVRALQVEINDLVLSNRTYAKMMKANNRQIMQKKKAINDLLSGQLLLEEEFNYDGQTEG